MTLRHLNLSRFFQPCCLVGILLVGLAGKLWLIATYGTAFPDPGQWRCGLSALVPEWAQGDVVLSRADAAVTYPLIPRAVLGALVYTNNQWDDRPANVLSALLLVLAAVAVLAVAAKRLRPTAFWITAMATGVLVALPLDWEQSLAGSALADRVALLLALPAAWLLVERTVSTAEWTAAAVALLAATATTDWTVAVAAALLAVVGVRLIATPGREGRDPAAAAVAITGILIHFAVMPGSWRDLAWPTAASFAASSGLAASTLGLLALIVALPLALQIATAMRDRDRKYSLAPFIGFVFSSLLSLCWISGHNAPRPWGAAAAGADLIILPIALAIAVVAQLWQRRWQTLPVRLGATAIWLLCVGLCLQSAIEHDLGVRLPERSHGNHLQSAAVNVALARGESSMLALLPTDRQLLPSAADSLALLRNPALASVLPAIVRVPVPIRNGPASTKDFSSISGEQFALPAGDSGWGVGPNENGEPALFLSQPLPRSQAGFLRFRITGDLGTDRFPFSLRSLSTGEMITLALPSSTGERWRVVNLLRPPDPVVIVAGPSSLGAWGAFTHPTETGSLAWAAGKLAKNWAWLLAGGGLCFGLALVCNNAPSPLRRTTFILTPDGQVRTR